MPHHVAWGVAGGVILQLVTALPFLMQDARSYVMRAFDLSRYGPDRNSTMMHMP